jgi:hypothetical protein
MMRPIRNTQEVKDGLINELRQNIQELSNASQYTEGEINTYLRVKKFLHIDHDLWFFVLQAIKEKLNKKNTVFNPSIFFFNQFSLAFLLMISMDPFKKFLCHLKHEETIKYHIIYSHGQNHKLAIYLERVTGNTFNIFLYDPTLRVDWMARALYLLDDCLDIRKCVVWNFAMHKTSSGCGEFAIEGLSFIASVDNFFGLFPEPDPREVKRNSRRPLTRCTIADFPDLGFDDIAYHFIKYSQQSASDPRGWLLNREGGRYSGSSELFIRMGGYLWSGFSGQRQILASKLETILGKAYFINLDNIPENLQSLLAMTQFVENRHLKKTHLNTPMICSLFWETKGNLTLNDHLKQHTVTVVNKKNGVTHTYNISYIETAKKIFELTLGYLQFLESSDPAFAKILHDRQGIQRRTRINVGLKLFLTVLVIGTILYLYFRPSSSAVKERTLPWTASPRPGF